MSFVVNFADNRIRCGGRVDKSDDGLWGFAAVALGLYFDSTVAAARAGAGWAWEVLYRDLAGAVTGYMRGHRAEEVEDLVSETFLSVAKDIHRFTGGERDFRSWVFTIAHRRMLDAWHSQGSLVPPARGRAPVMANATRPRRLSVRRSPEVFVPLAPRARLPLVVPNWLQGMSNRFDFTVGAGNLSGKPCSVWGPAGMTRKSSWECDASIGAARSRPSLP